MVSLLLFCLCTGIVAADLPCELYDVTTVLHVHGDAENNFEIHSTTNAVGIPLNPLSSTLPLTGRLPADPLSCEFREKASCLDWESEGFLPSKWRPEDPFRGDEDGAVQLSDKTGLIITSEFVVGKERAEICVSLRFFLENAESIQLIVSTVVNDTQSELSKEEIQGSGKIVSEQFVVVKPLWMQRNTKQRLKLQFTNNKDTGSFVLRSIRGCSSKHHDVVHFTPKMFQSPKKDQPQKLFGWQLRLEPSMLRFGYSLRCKESPESDINDSSKKCLNKGIEINGTCQCFPGYIGPTCSESCPPNRFGRDCSGVCYALGEVLDCKGVRLGAPAMELTCARGYMGPRCNQECPAYRHGPYCAFRCGHCAGGSTCDRFSGSCYGECQPGYLGPKCDKTLEYASSPVLTSVGFDYIEGRLNTSLNEETLKSYPYAEIRYAELGKEEKINLFPLTSSNQDFRISKLVPGKQYYLYSLIIHENGQFFNDTNLPPVVTGTECNACAEIADIKTEVVENALTVKWKVYEKCSYPCSRTGFQLEVNSPESSEANLVTVQPDKTEKNLTLSVPSQGTVRLRVSYTTKKGDWSKYVQFTHKYALKQPGTLKVVGKTSSSIDFEWTKDGAAPILDDIHCRVESLLCRSLSSRTGQQVRLVSGEQFTGEHLRSFANYVCVLENERVSVSTITDPSLPSASPIQKSSTKATEVTEKSAKVYWEDADCRQINGMRRGFRIELLQKGSLLTTKMIDPEDQMAFEFVDLARDTPFEARIFVQNHLGFNQTAFLSVPFRTKK